MGYYIETNSNKGKADWIINNCKGLLPNRAKNAPKAWCLLS